ncbi:DUF4238 domain-containing protein [Agrobacterium tumefaciens]|uniref:DUF4238 domain-containing protein n=1 Tax=Agrobacterium tumefaciens TaxID=358 RepID=UPI00023A1DD1|nr:hypothetical protein AT5A_27588 [Agrobacterium tumefaciens 5A]
MTAVMQRVPGSTTAWFCFALDGIIIRDPLLMGPSLRTPHAFGRQRVTDCERQPFRPLFIILLGRNIVAASFLRFTQMSGNAPHRHHYVPRMVQRNFKNESGGLYFWRRGMNNGYVRITKPSNLFVEDHLYTIIDKNGARDHSIEHWFGRLETLAAPFIQEFLNIVRHGLTPIMNRTHWDLWHTYVYHAQKRTVAWHKRFLKPEDLLAVIKEIASEQQWLEHIKAWETDPKNTLREMNNARIAAQADPMPDEMMEEFRNLGLVIYVAPPKTSFILGDDMSGDALISSRGEMTGARRVQFMPIAPDVAVGYCDTRGVHTDHLTAMDVRRMNEAMAKQAYLIAGRSKAQIDSLSRIPCDPPDIIKDWLESRNCPSPASSL